MTNKTDWKTYTPSRLVQIARECNVLERMREEQTNFWIVSWIPGEEREVTAEETFWRCIDRRRMPDCNPINFAIWKTQIGWGTYLSLGSCGHVLAGPVLFDNFNPADTFRRMQESLSGR